ncbi:hypothetical protein CSA37_08950 [Candidatus Fermentibacteria bacterium]|nr:MAG: hypothetical protein CSA37_08950 [Candidatus Fermentibacteria bacterium]
MGMTIPAELASNVVWFCSKTDVAAEEKIIRKGTHGNELYIITSGEFRVHDKSAGEDYVLALLKRGDIFGEMSFIDGSLRSASVTAAVPGSVLIMGREEYSAMLKKEPEIAVAFMRFLSGVVCRRLRTANDALLQVTFGSQEKDDEDQILKNAIASMHEAVRIELEGS